MPISFVSPDQAKLAMQVVPLVYWNINRWVCRSDGHAIYRCPFLTAAQRLYFAYRYYLYQLQKKPHMQQYLHDRAVARAQSQQQPGVQGQQGGPSRGPRFKQGPRTERATTASTVRRSTAMALDVANSVANAEKDRKSRGYVTTRRVKTGRRASHQRSACIFSHVTSKRHQSRRLRPRTNSAIRCKMMATPRRLRKKPKGCW